jgi:hypothetical protein
MYTKNDFIQGVCQLGQNEVTQGQNSTGLPLNQKVDKTE